MNLGNVAQTIHALALHVAILMMGIYGFICGQTDDRRIISGDDMLIKVRTVLYLGPFG